MEERIAARERDEWHKREDLQGATTKREEDGESKREWWRTDTRQVGAATSYMVAKLQPPNQLIKRRKMPEGGGDDLSFVVTRDLRSLSVHAPSCGAGAVLSKSEHDVSNSHGINLSHTPPSITFLLLLDSDGLDWMDEMAKWGHSFAISLMKPLSVPFLTISSLTKEYLHISSRTHAYSIATTPSYITLSLSISLSSYVDHDEDPVRE
ncbi:unnamed protein product [Sphenostylis stenocarpa]|uniref:Uncharacterized protein n=1 Tax=Sphenostylis stenocarpa TaxID=92480 RepID=A0AA86T002_9FABA|nr:unnamed protein product [Sphenostylis stenocarpa]